MEKPAAKSAANHYRDGMKWWLLGLLALSQLSSVYNVTSLGTLQVQFQKELGMTELGYSRIGSLQAIPGFFLPLIAGATADYYGASIGVGIGLVIGLACEILITFGIFSASYPSILIGFVLQQSVMQIDYLGKNKIIKLWYKDNEFSRALSLMTIAFTLSMFLGDILCPTLYELAGSLKLPYTVGVGIFAISLFAGMAQIIIHEKYLRLQKEDLTNEAPPVAPTSLSFKMIKELPVCYWIVLVATTLNLNCFSNTKMYESKLLQTKFNFSPGMAGIILSVGLVLAGVVSPLAGFLMDKYGRLPHFLIFSVLTVTCGIFGNIIIPSCDQCFLPIIPLLIMSLGSGIISIVGMSAVMRLVKASNIGVSMAIMFIVSSMAQLVVTWVNGEIAEITYKESGYYWVFLSDTAIGVFTVFLAVILPIIDLRGDQKLQHAVLPRKKSDSQHYKASEELTDIDEDSALIGEKDFKESQSSSVAKELLEQEKDVRA